ARSRRISLEDPGRSLLLTKPTAAIPHKGGQRFPVDSQEYKILSNWIAEGAQAPSDDDPKLVRLEMLPAQVQLKPGVKQQFVTLAHYSDGHIQDATHWAKYSSTNESVASVEQSGLVKVTGHGE